jgi:hypothetical protein
MGFCLVNFLWKFHLGSLLNYVSVPQRISCDSGHPMQRPQVIYTIVLFSCIWFMVQNTLCCFLFEVVSFFFLPGVTIHDHTLLYNATYHGCCDRIPFIFWTHTYTVCLFAKWASTLFCAKIGNGIALLDQRTSHILWTRHNIIPLNFYPL